MGKAGLALCLLSMNAVAGVVVNEVAFDEPAGSPDWVELYNPGPGDADLVGWVLDDGDTADGNEIHFPGGTTLPAGAYLLVYVDADGTGDLDFSDGTGTYYSGTATTVRLAATEDQVALYAGLPLSSATIVDFTAWVTDGRYDGAGDETHVHAAEAGIWPEDGAVSLTDTGSGYSLGRGRDGRDTDRIEDFQFFGRPTPGLSNLPAPSPYPASLTVEPGREAFSPFDPDPSFQTTRFHFNAGSPEAVKTLRVYDVRGREVRVLVDGDREPGGADLSGLGSGSVVWDGRDGAGVIVPVGIYVVTLDAAEPGGARVRAREVVAVGRPR